MEVFEVEEVEIEAYAKRGEAVPCARRYRIRIDKTPYVTENPEPTGAEILSYVGKTAEAWKLYQVFRGQQPVPVEPGEKVNLMAPAVERFTTVPKDPGEGLVSDKPRRDFKLGEPDTEFLDSLKLSWETRQQGGAMWVVINGWALPVGYNVPQVSVALAIPTGYPDTQIDMAFFSPFLHRQDGVPIGALSTANVAGEQWQQWSRHRTAANPWRPGVDDISSHLALVDDWLRREFRRN
jgi:hypothetical protein